MPTTRHPFCYSDGDSGRVESMRQQGQFYEERWINELHFKSLLMVVRQHCEHDILVLKAIARKFWLGMQGGFAIIVDWTCVNVT